MAAGASARPPVIRLNRVGSKHGRSDDRNDTSTVFAHVSDRRDNALDISRGNLERYGGARARKGRNNSDRILR